MRLYAKEENGLTTYDVMLEGEGEATLAGLEQRKAERPVHVAVTLPASGWAGAGPYAQTVAAAGILATDTPLVDIVLSDTAATAKTQLEAYGLVGRIDTLAGQIKATCYEDKPGVNMVITLKVVR